MKTINIEMSSIPISESKCNKSLVENLIPQSKSTGSIPSLRISSLNNQSISEQVPKVSGWYDVDGYRTFMKNIASGDIVELRNSRTSHWGIIQRLKHSSPNGKRQEPDEIMVYHLIHSPKNRGQVGQYTIEEFWSPECRIRINNTTNGMSLYGRKKNIPKSDVLSNALTAHLSHTLKWQTCCDFIRWSCDEETHPSLKSSSAHHSIKENQKI